MLQVSVKDYGPIIEGTVELTPLTVFVGPSNAGKSYMATLVYSIMKSLSQHQLSPVIANEDVASLRGLQSTEGVFPALDGAIARANLDMLLADVEAWVSAIDHDDEITVKDLPITFQEIISDAIGVQLTALAEDIWSDQFRCYVDGSDLVRRKSNGETFEVNLTQGPPFLSIAMTFGGPQSEVTVHGREFDISAVRLSSRLVHQLVNLRVEDADRYLTRPYVTELVLSVVRSTFLSAYFELVGIPRTDSHYLPGARSGLLFTYKQLAASYMRGSHLALVRPLAMLLPGVVTDFVANLIELPLRLPMRRGHAEIDAVVQFIEDRVVEGSIYFEHAAEIGLQEIVFESHDGSGTFPLFRTASIATELAPLVLYLKHLVNGGDLLVIEEPEAHLHPARQLLMANAIARLVNVGVNVILTTHNDLFLGAINNLIRLGAASQDQLHQLGRDGEDGLRLDQVSAYLFDPVGDGGGTVIKRLEVSSDIGIDDAGFASVVESLYEESISLQRISP